MADCNDEPDCCPLCMEELDITDQTFNACPCGYQVCLWCWHQIKNEYNGLCPACRQPYAELSKQKNLLNRDEVVRRTKQRKLKEKSERRSAAQAKNATVNRKSLQNVRVMQRNLVYVIGLPVQFAEEDILRSTECFGQYGKIVKAVVNKSHLTMDRANATASAYITFALKEDALCCIIAIDGYYLDGSLLRASFGTTKYCNFFLRNMQCNNPECLYLHELGDDDDSFTKEEMQSALHSGKAAFRELSMANGQVQEREGTHFPPPHRPSRSTSRPRSLGPSPAGCRSQSDDPFGDSQRHAQSAAAISKLRQSAEDRSSSGSLSPDQSERRHSSGYLPLTRGHSYGNIVAGHSGSTSVDGAVYRKPELRVDTSREEDKERGTEAVIGPLEALKLATGTSTEQPAWAQPFPTPVVSQTERDELNGTRTTELYNPFGLGFEGRLHGASSGRDATSESPAAGELWGSSTLSDTQLDPFPLTTSGVSASATSSSSFASIDAIFSQRNESSEALAGLLGVDLASTPLTHSPPVAAPPKDAHTSRFSFANAAETSHGGLQHSSARYELLDGTTVKNKSAFGGFDASHSAPSSDFSTTALSDFSALGSSQQPLHRAPLPPPPPVDTYDRDFSSKHVPFEGSRGLSGGSEGLAFLQQMLPNVNISFGGDYPSLSDAGPSAGRSTGTGRRLFERSQSLGGSLSSPDTWGSRRASSGALFYDSALQSSGSFSANFSGLGFADSMPFSDSGPDQLSLHSDFRGELYRHSGSLINNS